MKLINAQRIDIPHLTMQQYTLMCNLLNCLSYYSPSTLREYLRLMFFFVPIGFYNHFRCKKIIICDIEPENHFEKKSKKNATISSLSFTTLYCVERIKTETHNINIHFVLVWKKQLLVRYQNADILINQGKVNSFFFRLFLFLSFLSFFLHRLLFKPIYSNKIAGRLSDQSVFVLFCELWPSANPCCPWSMNLIWTNICALCSFYTFMCHTIDPSKVDFFFFFFLSIPIPM